MYSMEYMEIISRESTGFNARRTAEPLRADSTALRSRVRAAR
jgi:hypothetical protein